MKFAPLLIVALWLAACAAPGEEPGGGDLPPMTSYTDTAVGLTFDYPADWYVHTADKMIQITPNAQPIWSSFFDPNEPHGGPYFDLLHNLNRQMGATPLAEAELLLAPFNEMTAPLQATAALPGRSDVVVGVYRFAADEQALLVGAAVNPVADSPQATVSLSGVVDLEDLAEMQPVFEAILRSLRAAVAP
jgi:hypothetical protein